MANPNVNSMYRNVAQAGMTAGSVGSPRTPKFKMPSGVNNGGRYDVPMPAPANKQKTNGVNFSGANGALSFPARRAVQPQQQQGNMWGNITQQGAPGSPMVSPPMVGQPAQVSPAQFMGGFMPMPQGQGSGSFQSNPNYNGGINPGGNMFPGSPINPINQQQAYDRQLAQSQAIMQRQQNQAMANTGMMRPMPFRGMPQLM
jgi:hypothetical protein